MKRYCGLEEFTSDDGIKAYRTTKDIICGPSEAYEIITGFKGGLMEFWLYNPFESNVHDMGVTHNEFRCEKYQPEWLNGKN